MAAIAGYYIHTSQTVDSQIGLNADLTGMLIDSFSISAERGEIIHQNFAGNEVIDIRNMPKLSATIGAKVMARTTGVTNGHPGTAISRATISQFRSGTNHGFDLTEGWWIFGTVTHEQPRGDLDVINFPVKLFGFSVTSTGTLVSANP